MPVNESEITGNLGNHKIYFINVAYAMMYYGISIIFLFSGIMKIVDPIPTMDTLKTVFHFSDTLNLIIATMLPLVEIAIAALLLLNMWQKQILLIVSILFLCFFLFAVYGTITGISNDCGCFGNVVKSEFGWNMIIRNFLFLSISVAAMIIKLKQNV